MADQLPETDWSAILDELEAELNRGSDPSTPWRPPATATPLPESLAERARDLVDAQRRVIGELTDELATVGQHLHALDSVPPAQTNDRSVYLDVVG